MYQSVARIFCHRLLSDLYFRNLYYRNSSHKFHWTLPSPPWVQRAFVSIGSYEKKCAPPLYSLSKRIDLASVAKTEVRVMFFTETVEYSSERAPCISKGVRAYLRLCGNDRRSRSDTLSQHARSPRLCLNGHRSVASLGRTYSRSLDAK